MAATMINNQIYLESLIQKFILPMEPQPWSSRRGNGGPIQNEEKTWRKARDGERIKKKERYINVF